tara:strand:- start:11176 stop:14679 length:3504 start_codon:yes stop_codon:yes gene_type:complete
VNRYIIAVSLFIMVLLASFSGFSYAEDGAATSCGMISVTGGENVEPMNGEICPEDISFQSLYLFYEDIFEHPFWRLAALTFVSESTLDSEFTKFAAQTIDLSSIIYSLMSAVAIFCWAIASAILPYKFYTYVTMIRKTGSLEFSDSKGDTVRFVSYFSFLVLLILPVGGITFGQGAAVISGLPSIMGGNYIYSTFLSSSETASTDVELSEGGLLPDSQVFVNEMIESELCQSRTRQAIMSLNANAGSHFFSNSVMQALPFVGEDQSTIVDRYSACLGYVGEIERGDRDSILTVKFEKRPAWERNCPVDWGFADAMNYDPDLYGHSHSCGKVTYDNGINKFEPLYNESDSWFSEDLEDITENIQKSFSTSAIYPSFRRATRASIETVLNQTGLTDEERFKKLEELFIEKASSVIESRLANNATLGEGSNDEIQLKHLVATNAMLGGVLEEEPDGVGSGLFEWTAFNRYYGVNENREHYFGLDYLLDEARNIADTFQRYHCAINWESHQEDRLFIVEFNESSSSDLEDLFAAKAAGLECVEFLSEDDRGDTAYDRYVRYPTLLGNPNSDIYEVDGKWFPKPAPDNSTQQQLNLSVQAKMETEVAAEYFNQMRVSQMLLAGYTMSVKLGTSNALSKALNQANIEREEDVNLRPKGWVAFGGGLLYMSKHYSNSKHMVDSIENAVSFSGGGDNSYFVATEAFTQDSDTILGNLQARSFTPLDGTSLLMPGVSGVGKYPGPGGVSSEKETEQSMNILMSFITWMFFEPVEHIKSASGMSPNGSLSQGFQACYDGSYEQCISNHKHPIVALSNMGHDMMNNMLAIVATHAFVKVLNRTMFSSIDGGSGSMDGDGDDDGEAKKKDGLWDKTKAKFKKFSSKLSGPILKLLKGAARTVFAVISAISIPAETALDTLMPFVLTLFMVGVFFAYIIPMLAFIYSISVFLLWLLGISVVAFVIPIYSILKLKDVEKNYERGFQEFYEGFCGNYIKPFFFGIGAVIAWTMVTISLFLVNTIFSLINSGLDVTAGESYSMGSLVFRVMMFVTYFVVLFVMFKQALGFMKSFPDAMNEKLRLQKSNDEQKIDGLGFENYVQAEMLKQVAALPDSLVSRWAKNHDANKNMSKTQMRQETEENEDMMNRIDAEFGSKEEFIQTVVEFRKNQGNKPPDGSGSGR